MSSQPTILVVDDERDLTDLYATWFSDHYDVRTAYDGTTALEQMSDAVDIVLLDRRMPDYTGDEVLAEIRRRGHDCWVIMVTAVDPGLEIIDLDIDEYMTKPVTRAELTWTIDALKVQSRTNGRRTLRSLSSKKDTLEDELSIADLEGTDEYQRLVDDLEDLDESLVDGFES